MKSIPLSRSTILLIVLTLTVPLGAASHWSLYYDEFDESAGRTMEDDNAMIQASGNVLHGLANRVVYPGSTPGDGGLFLDARVATPTPGPSLFLADYLSEITGRRDVLFPGMMAVAAWFGEWHDFNDDHIIQDIPASACPTTCGGDEFDWRGAVSGHADVMGHLYMIDGPDHRARDMTDRTLEGEGWSADPNLFVRQEQYGGLITTTQVVTFVRAPLAIGSKIGYDLDDPRALVDVDRHAALSSDVEALYFSVLSEYRRVIQFDPCKEEPESCDLGFQAIASAISTVTSGVETAFGVVIPIAETPWIADLTTQVAGAANEANEQRKSVTLASPWFKEPNHVEDDYQNRALFGGVGDRMGSYNQYPGYETEFHLYFDNVAHLTSCGGAAAHPPAVGVSIEHGACVISGPTADEFDLDPSVNERQASTGALLAFAGIHMLWQDLNGDSHTGAMCDPESEAFDAERNSCTASRGSGFRWHNSQYGGETIPVCPDVVASTRVRGHSITVSPVDGHWPTAILVRDYQETVQAPRDPDSIVLLSGDAPVTLSWQFDCRDERPRGSLVSRDAILFPAGGTTVPLRVDATVTIEGYKDADLGIDFGFEYVRDVDVLPASL